MIGVLIGDEHELVRQGLRGVLEDASDIRVVGEASDGAEVLQQYQRIRPDVAMVEIAMSNEDGFETIRQLLSIDERARVLVVTGYPEEQFAARSFKAGVLGYITKSSSPAELHRAVRSVGEGRRYLPCRAPVAAGCPALTDRAQDDGVQVLSNRELQILCLIARGRKLSRISSDLLLCRKTVETYRRRLTRKLGLRGDADICRFAYDNRLIEGRLESA